MYGRSGSVSVTWPVAHTMNTDVKSVAAYKHTHRAQNTVRDMPISNVRPTPYPVRIRRVCPGKLRSMCGWGQ